MRILETGIFLYHGSYCEISTIDLTFSRRALDFGKGFYLTSSYQQAVSYIPSAVKKNIRRNIANCLWILKLKMDDYPYFAFVPVQG